MFIWIVFSSHDKISDFILMDKPNKKGNAPVSAYIEADFKP